MEQTSQAVNKSMGSNLNLDQYPLVELSREFQAPVEQVWKAWSNPELIKQWWGPEGFSCPEAKVDLREGGKAILAMKDPDGKVQYSGGVFKEIVPNEKIVLTDQFMDPEGNAMSAKDAGMPGDWPESGLITLKFERLGDNESRLSITHEGIPKEMHDDCVSGWSTSIDKLQRLVEKS